VGNKIKNILNVIKCDVIGITSNYKVGLSLVVLMLFLYDNFKPVFKFAKEAGYRVTPYLLPFCFTHPFMKIVIFSCILFMFSDAPFMTEFQVFMLSRAGKRCWYIAQMIYIALSSIMITFFLNVFPIVIDLPMIVLKGGWGKVIKTLATKYDMIHPVNYEVVEHYNAGTVMIYTEIMCVLLFFFMGMILFLCNIMFKNKSIGVFVMTAFVLIDWLYNLVNNSIGLLWISPFSWVDISVMAYSREKWYPSSGYAVIFLTVVNVVLIAVTYIAAKKKDINTYAEG
jgi:hypothetical protein